MGKLIKFVLRVDRQHILTHALEIMDLGFLIQASLDLAYVGHHNLRIKSFNKGEKVKPVS